MRSTVSVEPLANEAAVSLDFGIELLALIAHGLPRLIRRERAVLSVIDRSQAGR
jgi:hypothetical protein